MNFNIGNKVKFLNDIGGGIITRIEKKQIFVLRDDGFELPASPNQLLLDDSFQAENPNIPKNIPTENPQKITAPKTPPAPDIIEIDLHIDALHPHPKKLSPKQCLDLQIATCKKAINSAIAQNARRLIIIHGKGQGVLKLEITRLLATNYARFPYQDASFRKYGFGATMLILRK